MKRSVTQGARRMEYELIRSGRHDLMIKVLPQGEIRVFAPSYLPLREADKAVQMRMDEILRMHAALDQYLEAERLRHPVCEGSLIRVEGTDYRLCLKAGGRNALRLTEHEILLTTPQPEDEESVRAALRQALSKRALIRIRERLEIYAPGLGVSFGRVAVRDQKSRWGSCSQKHNLNFNWKLVLAPPEALDYVVIHELCHLIEFNHSARFWRLVGGIMPEYEAWKQWLKLHGPELGV